MALTRFPGLWKIAKVKPIFEKGNPAEVSNYRPISLLSLPSKLLESQICSITDTHLHRCSIKSSKQWGFKKELSTEGMLISMTERWKIAVGAVFIDFQNAFDTVPYNILSYKLHAIGISGSLHEWLMSYLSNRRQFTEVKYCKSTSGYVRYGVPQGSLLGLRLYTIYVNDLRDHVDSADIYLYADDTTVYCIGPTVDHVLSSLNKTLKQIFMWSNRNHLTIHPIKYDIEKICVYWTSAPLYFGTGLINRVDCTICLGVNIDNRLSWLVHIDSLRKHFSQKVGALKRMRAFPKKTLEEIYFKAILPSVTYGILVWGNCQPSTLTSLNSLHARASRIINNLQPSLADNVCLAKSKWLPFSYFYKRSVLMLMHKVYFETSCQSICNLFF